MCVPESLVKGKDRLSKFINVLDANGGQRRRKAGMINVTIGKIRKQNLFQTKKGNRWP